MASPAEIAGQFVQFYYSTFDSNRQDLVNLYRDTSTMSWETSSTVGAPAIVAKLVGLPFEKVAHTISTCDAQAASPSTIIVLVTGSLGIDGGPPIQFSQCFHLVPDGTSYFVFNDLFRLLTSG